MTCNPCPPIPIAVAMLAIVLGAPATARADPTWVCAYNTPDHPAPIIAHYVQKELQLFDPQQAQQFEVLQDNQYALVAVTSIAEIEPGNKIPTIATNTILIDKKSHDFVSAYLADGPLGRQSGGEVRGSCVEN